MKILQINNCHYRRGGADVVYLNTGKLLEEYGHQVIYFSQKNIKNEFCLTSDYFIEYIDFIKTSYLKKILSFFRFFYSYESIRKISNLILKEKPDIAHIHTFKGTLTPSILKALKKYSIPVVITLHDYGLLCPHNLLINGKGKICTKCLETGSSFHCIINKCNRNNLILSTVSFLEFNFYKIFFPPEKYFNTFITVCYFSLQLHSQNIKYKENITQLYNFAPQILNNNLSFTRGEYFLYFGRLSNEKGVINLLNAWISVSNNQKLKIVGDGPQRDEILDLIKDYSLKNVEYLGFKKNDELSKLIINSSFIVVPSEVNENNPMTIIEAYSNGKPVIGSNVGGIPEILIDEITGYLFDMGNIEHLASTIDKATSIKNEDYIQLSKNAKQFSDEHFSKENHYDALLNIYKKYLSE